MGAPEGKPLEVHPSDIWEMLFSFWFLRYPIKFPPSNKEEFWVLHKAQEPTTVPTQNGLSVATNHNIRIRLKKIMNLWLINSACHLKLHTIKSFFVITYCYHYFFPYWKKKQKQKNATLKTIYRPKQHELSDTRFKYRNLR